MILFGIDILLIGLTYWSFKSLVFDNDDNIINNNISNSNNINTPPSYQQSLNDSVISELPPSYE